MKFFTVIVLAFVLICTVHAQRYGPRGPGPRGPGPAGNQGGGQAECPGFCPLNYQPTCGFNGRCYKEFSNSCALNAASCNGEGNFRQANIQECSKRGARLC